MIESKNLLVAVKAYSRGNALPLDASEVQESYAAAETYAKSATAYPGQTIKALLEDGKYHTYTLQPSDSGYILEEVGAINESDLKQYVQVVEELPASGQEEGILYISDTTGSVWNGTGWKTVFKDISSDVDALNKKVTSIEETLDSKAPIADPVFTGTIKIGTDEVAIKSWVEGLIANIQTGVPGIVNNESTLPTTGYKAGQTWRVSDEGTFAGVDCEVGDLIICIANYDETSASDDDFMVIQANIDGAVTSVSETSTVGEIVVFDAITGKVIKGSGVNIASLNDAIEKAHTHENIDKLNSYDKTQTELLDTASANAQSLIDTYKTTVDEALEGKADKGTTLADYGITDAYTSSDIDLKLSTITQNLNTKVDAKTVDDKISAAKEEITEEYTSAISDRIGDIDENTSVKDYITSYVETAVGAGGTASAEAIATAKSEAIESSKKYTDDKISEALTIVEF